MEADTSGLFGFLTGWFGYCHFSSAPDSGYTPNYVSYSVGSLESSGCQYARPLDTGFLISQLIGVVLVMRSLRLLPLELDGIGHLRTP
ncbi:hypothetical protein TIFTF001_015439 [Ficus carica]|uniref:Uncharacterized protein n=1 Tax=Ficus carica TaxID=3494 RepID=A0AA88A766_FICCA|nr:hypothetical protein TIFTF001_015439 [Ficus carica]